MSTYDPNNYPSYQQNTQNSPYTQNNQYPPYQQNTQNSPYTQNNQNPSYQQDNQNSPAPTNYLGKEKKEAKDPYLQKIGFDPEDPYYKLENECAMIQGTVAYSHIRTLVTGKQYANDKEPRPDYYQLTLSNPKFVDPITLEPLEEHQLTVLMRAIREKKFYFSKNSTPLISLELVPKANSKPINIYELNPDTKEVSEYPIEPYELATGLSVVSYLHAFKSTGKGRKNGLAQLDNVFILEPARYYRKEDFTSRFGWKKSSNPFGTSSQNTNSPQPNSYANQNGAYNGQPVYNNNQGQMNQNPAQNAQNGIYNGQPTYNNNQGQMNQNPAQSAQNGVYNGQPTYNNNQGQMNQNPAQNAQNGAYNGQPTYNNNQGQVNQNPAQNTQNSPYTNMQSPYTNAGNQTNTNPVQNDQNQPASSQSPYTNNGTQMNTASTANTTTSTYNTNELLSNVKDDLPF